MAVFIFQLQAIMNIMLPVQVTCYESSSRPDPHLTLPCHIGLGVRLVQGCDSWKWFEDIWTVCFQSTLWDWMRDTCKFALGCNLLCLMLIKWLLGMLSPLNTCNAAYLEST